MGVSLTYLFVDWILELRERAESTQRGVHIINLAREELLGCRDHIRSLVAQLDLSAELRHRLMRAGGVPNEIWRELIQVEDLEFNRDVIYPMERVRDDLFDVADLFIQTLHHVSPRQVEEIEATGEFTRGKLKDLAREVDDILVTNHGEADEAPAILAQLRFVDSKLVTLVEATALIEARLTES